jgi:cytoskeletal protein CcmA (bactofilin family)
MKTARLVIDDGAVFEGRCSMQKDNKMPYEVKNQVPKAIPKRDEKSHANPFGQKSEKTL